MSAHFFSDTIVMTGRSLRHVTRSMDTIITVTIMPIAFMLLFVYVFGGAIQAGTDNYVNYLLPGILLIAIASGISYTAFRLFNDLQSGIFERFHSMPSPARPCCGACSDLTGVQRDLRGSHRPCGTPHGLSLVGRSAGMAGRPALVLFTLALTWIACSPDCRRNPRTGRSASRTDHLPCRSSARHSWPLPRAGSRACPSRKTSRSPPSVNTIRACSRAAGGGGIWIPLAWGVGIPLIAYALAMRAYRRKTA